MESLMRRGQDERLYNLEPSPDGKHLTFGAMTWDSNVWMIEDL